MTDFNTYMEKINIHYEFLKKYYKSDDIATIYGVDKYEIKHSNVLKWILEPKGDEAIDYLPIRSLLKIIQENNCYYDFFNTIILDTARIEKVIIQREKYNIDMLITLKINNEDYIIAIENKLESDIHDNQLEDYKNKLKIRYPKHKKLYVFLHPGINSIQEKEAKDNQYITITYQDIYDKVLKTIVELTANTTIKFIIYYYIHTLCCYESNNLIGLIVTDEEAVSLKSLFNDTQIITMIDMLYSNSSNNEYSDYYNKNKTNFYKIFKKYQRLKNADNSIKLKIEKILKDKAYLLNGTPCKSITEILYLMFNELLNIENKTIEDIHELRYLLSSTDPLLIEKEKLDESEHPKWYSANPRILKYQEKEYYILSSWYSAEYEELKEKFKILKQDNPDVYGKIILE